MKKRLRKLNLALWKELQQCAGMLCDRLDPDEHFGAWRARVYLLRGGLHELAPLFKNAVECRMSVRWDEDVEPFRVTDATWETIIYLLKRIDDDREDVREFLEDFLGDDLETGIGPGFLAALERFKLAFRDIQVAWNMLDNIDYEGDGDPEGPKDPGFDEARLTKLDKNLLARRSSSSP